ncbi:MAG: exo-alpha-sialidase [Clostridiales bacterium]|nr:exo-alpha-sialidase [Clostridiales bacterium]
MKINLLGKPQVIMSNPLSRHNYFAWPTVCRLKNGRIAVAASGFRLKHICPFGKTVLSISEDEGETYTLPAPVIDTVLDDRDGGIMAFGHSGAIVTSFNNTLGFQKNLVKEGDGYLKNYLDLITTQEEERDIGAQFRISFDNAVTFGEVHKSPVTSPHGPIELKDGTILWVGRTFSPVNEIQPDTDCIKAYRVNLDGSMEYLGQIENIYVDGRRLLSCEPCAFETNDGRIICHIRAQVYSAPQIFTTYQCESTDGGRTWSKPYPLLEREGGAPAHIMRHCSGVLISVYGYRKGPYGIKAMFSFDEGRTWDTGHDIYVNHVGGDLGYPSTIELIDGSLLTVFYAVDKEGEPAKIYQQKWSFEK